MTDLCVLHSDSWLSGNVRIDVHNRGRVVHRMAVENLVVLSGRNQVRDAIFGDLVLFPTHVALGTGGAGAREGDVALQDEVFRSIVTTRAKSSAAVSFKLFLTSAQANGHTLREAGLFNAPIFGTLFARVVHGEIPKTASVTVLYTWTITIGTPTTVATSRRR